MKRKRERERKTEEQDKTILHSDPEKQGERGKSGREKTATNFTRKRLKNSKQTVPYHINL